MMAQGIVCGAQLFAGEKDAGSLAFLDMLSSRRLPVWRNQVACGHGANLPASPGPWLHHAGVELGHRDGFAVVHHRRQGETMKEAEADWWSPLSTW